MAYVRPTLPQLAAQVRADIESRLSGADARLRRNNLDVQASVLGNGLDGVYSFIEFLSKQMFPQTATGIYLEYLAALQNVFKKLPSAAEGPAGAVGTNTSIIGAGIPLKRNDGALFITTTDVVVAGGVATLRLVAMIAGSAGNTPAGSILTFVNGVEGVNPSVTVTGGLGLTDGSDIETDDELRARLLDVWQQEPQGGAAWDYIARAKTVPGVTRAWVFPAWMGLGTVGLTFVMDDQVGSIIPSDDAVAQVYARVTDPGWKPIEADVYVFKPTALPVNVTVALTPDTPALRTAVTNGLLSMFLVRQSVGGAYLPPDGTQTAGIIPYGLFWAAVTGSIGDGEVELTAPTADVVAGRGQLPILGTVTFA
jgi:uncharacterized phage protein gp47/JayE